MLVPLVEAGELESPGTDYFIRKYWEQTNGFSDKIDVLLLACTHYPLLLPAIRATLPPRVRILVQGDFVAPSLVDYLQRHPEIEQNLTRGATQRFLTTDHTEGFDKLAEVFLGHPVVSESVAL
jgi:glutamate racemase